MLIRLFKISSDATGVFCFVPCARTLLPSSYYNHRSVVWFEIINDDDDDDNIESMANSLFRDIVDIMDNDIEFQSFLQYCRQ